MQVLRILGRPRYALAVTSVDVSEGSAPVDLLIVGADDEAAAELMALPEVAGLAVERVPRDAGPRGGATFGAAVVYASHTEDDVIARWLSCLAPTPTLLVADGTAPAPHIEVVSRDRVAARLLRNLQRLVGDPEPPSLQFCLGLLRTASELQLCQSITEEAARLTGATWVALLRVTAEARAFEVTGSVGSVSAALHGCHNMTPDELASALGWNVERAAVQYVKSDDSALARAISRGGMAAFALLAGRRAHQGILIAGWAPPVQPSPTALASLAAIGDLGAAALRHADLVADLRVSERTKSEFVATMSHELRNPLTAILGYTELMAHGDFGSIGDEQRDVLRRAHHSASSLLDLINATLDVSRFEVGGRADQTSEIDLTSLLREQIDEISGSRHREEVRIDLAATGPLFLLSDPLKVRVAVRQLFEAAISTNEGISLHAAARPLSDGFAVEIAPEGMSDLQRAAAVVIELPEDGEMPAVPFAVFVARRLLEILGGTLALWRDETNDRVGFRMWIPGR